MKARKIVWAKFLKQQYKIKKKNNHSSRISDNSNINLVRKLIPVEDPRCHYRCCIYLCKNKNITNEDLFHLLKKVFKKPSFFKDGSFSKKHLFSEMEVYFSSLIDDRWKTIFSKKVS